MNNLNHAYKEIRALLEKHDGTALLSYKFSTENNKYSFMVSRDGVQVWVDDGTTSILHVEYDGDVEKTLEKIAESVNQAECGIAHCCDCGCEAPLSELRWHRYFAGIYCQRCWDGKWKAIEAKETYD